MKTGKKPTVYLETSVISYIVGRRSRDLVSAAHQDISREWWEERRNQFDLLISDVVLREIALGHPKAVDARKRLIQGIKILDVTQSVNQLAKTLLDKLVLPSKATNDALHIALVAAHHIDFIVTWNCKHIANGSVKRKINPLFRSLGYESPTICTPLELMDTLDCGTR